MAEIERLSEGSRPVLTRRAALAGSALTLIGEAARAQPWPPPRPFRIGGGPLGGSYLGVAEALAKALTSTGEGACSALGECGVPGIAPIATPARGSVDNVGGLRRADVDMAIVQADVAVFAFRGEGPSAGPPMPWLRAIAALFTEYVHVIVRAGSSIASVQSLRGRPIALGEAGSGSYVNGLAILAAYGMTEADVAPRYVPLATGFDMLLRREVDAMFATTGAPAPFLAGQNAGAFALVPIGPEGAQRLLAREPYFRPAMILPGAYSNVGAVPTVGVDALLVGSAEAPAAFVRDITAAIWSARAVRMFADAAAEGRAVRLERAITRALPLHPGAQAFYREVGLEI